MSSHPTESTDGVEKVSSGKASAEIEEIEAIPASSSSTVVHTSEDDLHADSLPLRLSPAEERRLYRKIDWRLMPILTLMQLFSFLDKANIGNAKLQGLTTQLHLTGNNYNNALALYFLTYVLLECPAGLVTKKLRPSRWLPGITIAWGIIMTLMGLVTSYQQLVGVRLLLGAAEAGIFPGITWYLSIWYPRHELQFRIAMFWGGATIAGAFSGLLAFGISFMSGVGGKEGWSWIFIIEGLMTVVVGIAGIFMLVDFPSTAKFLTPEERAYVAWKRKYDNSSVGEAEAFHFRHVWAAFADWKTWTHAAIFVSLVGPLYGISYFLPSIINGFGFTPAISQLLSVPPYVFASALGLVFAVFSDRLQVRYPFVLAGHAMCLLGFGIQITNAHFAVKYFGTFFCVAGSYGVFPGIASWISNNTAGQYKRGTAIAINVAFGNTAGSIASALYRSEDAPRYIVGDAVELGFISLGVIAVSFALFNYTRINAKRERALREMAEKGVQYSPEQLREMGDLAPDFKYTL